MTKIDTRTRILVSSLTLFNEHGEPNTTTNDIADEADISPGNLHYHYRKKSAVVDALLFEFQADAKRVLQPPDAGRTDIEDFWAFQQVLLEILAAYRFLLRDTETLVENYPNVRKALAGFTRALSAVMELYIVAMQQDGILNIGDRQIPAVCRSLVIIALFSERFDEVSGVPAPAAVSALRTARALLGVLWPYASDSAAPLFAELAEHYD